MNYSPYNYQKFSFDHVISHEYSGLFLDMGLGKTVITLTALDFLMYHDLEISKVLVIAPKRVAESVWTDEIRHWDHLRHLRPSVVLGSKEKRVKALQQDADVYIINRENVVWLVNYYQSRWPFDMIVIDELSSFKSSKSARFRALRTVRPRVKRVVGLTGTPAPNSLIDLWPQLYLLDQGERLGKTVTGYRDKYFFVEKQHQNIVYKYGIKPEASQTIYGLIQDICISMKSSDYLELPDIIENKILLTLSPETKKQYDDFEESQIMTFLDSGVQISTVNAAALTNKLLQFSNGAVYDDTMNYHAVHDEKLDVLESLVEEAQGQPVLVAYTYQHDLKRILKRLPQAVQLKSKHQIDQWNRKEIPVLVLHPASGGHGLNLQSGGNTVIWFGSTWSSELYQQLNKRLHRQGQENTVIVHRIISKGTMDEDVVKALDKKISGQNALMEAIKARISKYKATFA
jgi:SNF2 family DNA or RNA helicase